MPRSTLQQMAEASQDAEFGAKVMAAAAFLKLPHHLPYILQAAAAVDLSNGLDAVTDEDIFAALQPESDPAPIDPDPEPIPEEPKPEEEPIPEEETEPEGDPI